MICYLSIYCICNCEGEWKMEQKKSKKLLIVIIVLIVLIVLTIGGIAFTYFATDVFKTNKELFVKYASSLFDQEKGFVDSSLKQYYEKLKSTAYENNGTLDFTVNIPNAKEITEIANNFNIRFSGKVDSANGKAQQDITLDYGNDVQFPISYRQVGNMVGLQTDYVGSNYIAIRNENLPELVQNLGLTSTFTNVPEKLEFSENSNSPIFTQEEMKQLQEKYLSNVISELQDNNFTKIETSLGEGYQLTLDGTQLKSVIGKILDTLKNDTNLLDKINQIAQSSEKIDTNTIEEMQKNISNNTSLDSEKLEIVMYQQNGGVNKITIQINEGKLEIEKVKGGNELQYLVTLQNTDGTQKIYLTIRYTGIQTDNVSESFELGISYPYQEETQSEELTSEQEKEMVEKLIADAKSTKLLQGQDSTTITDQDIETTLNPENDVNYQNMKLEKLSDTSFKITFISSNQSYEFDNTGKITKEPEVVDVQNNEDGQEEQDSQIMQYQYNYENNVKITGNVAIEDMTQDNTVILNDLDSETATNLINAIGERINQVNEDQMGKLGIAGAQNPILYVTPLTDILGNTGGTATSMNQQELEVFNSKFTIYESTNTKGATVKGLLTVIQTNNEESDKKIAEINFDGQEYEVTEQNITLIKSSINVDDDYKVEFEYDRDTGAIYRTIINKK